MHSIAIYGGAFDPVHLGHLQTSVNIQNYFKFNDYFFLPCKIPTLKSPTLADNQQRIKMLELAIKNYPDFKLDLREIERDTPSYMVETLESFRQEFPQASITLIIGYDAFISLPHWNQWDKLITLANILVINRNEYADEAIPELLQRFLDVYQKQDKTELLNKGAGTVFLFDAGYYKISSTGIREEIKRRKDVSSMLTTSVYQYIKEKGLYL